MNSQERIYCIQGWLLKKGLQELIIRQAENKIAAG